MKIDWSDRIVPCGGTLEDCLRIQKVIAYHFIIDVVEAFDLWTEYSQAREASWMALPKSDEDLLKWIMRFISS